MGEEAPAAAPQEQVQEAPAPAVVAEQAPVVAEVAPVQQAAPVEEAPAAVEQAQVEEAPKPKPRPAIAPKPKLVYVQPDGQIQQAPLTPDGPNASLANVLTDSLKPEVPEPPPPEVRIPSQLAHVHKGYKILADVGKTEDFNYAMAIPPRSKGGKMFQKQKKRMEKFTSEASEGTFQYEPEYIPVMEPPSRAGTAMQGRGTPWDMAKNSNAGVRYLPTSMYSAAFPKTQRVKKGSMLAPMPAPPAEWRAKVESGYQYTNPDGSTPMPRNTKRWNVADAAVPSQESGRNSVAGSQSRILFQDEEPQVQTVFSNSTKFYNGHPRSYNGSSSGMPVATINFNARNHIQEPHRLQDHSDQYISQPYACYDFNATAVGWWAGAIGA